MVQDFQYFQSFLFTDRRCLEYVTDKSKSSASIVNYMLARLQKMFKYKRLPESLPKQYLENYLLVNGSCIVARDKKNPSDKSIYAFVGAAGGEPDIYYRPTRYMVANPSLAMSAEYYISTTDPNHEPDAVLIRNDTMWQGLYPMMARYASLISENLLTIRTADVMLRVLALITAPDDSSRLAANEFLQNIQDGKLASVMENRFLDGIHMQNPPSNNGSYLTQFIELHQYLVGSFYNEVGLNANYNMKREALSETETGLNDDSLLPLCEDMLRCRQEDIARVNSMFGTSIELSFDSSWLENELERLLSIKEQLTSTTSTTSSQLATPAAQGDGMEDDSNDGASMEGAGLEDAGGQNENSSGDDKEGIDESNNISGELDSGFEDGIGMDENGEQIQEGEEGSEEKIDEKIEELIDEIIDDDTGNIEEGNSGKSEDNEDRKEGRADVQVSESESDNAGD